MENRKPYDLQYVLIVYNFIQVCFSGFIVLEVSMIYVSYSFIHKPDPVVPTTFPRAPSGPRNISFSLYPRESTSATGKNYHWVIKVTY